MPHLEGREVGGCKLIRKIGAGGMGDVYLGEQIRVGNRSVAVKVVSPEDMTFHPDAARDIARRFEREAAILGNLSHPNILPVHDSGIQDGMLYLVMEYAPDGSLADALRGGGTHTLKLPLPIPFALDLISQVADALQYTHDHGIVHRDVKPGNVLIRVEPSGHWHVLLADYGVARNLEVDSQRTQVTGTFIYMAPEQFSAKFSPASDQYALAVMTFQLLAGRPPFDGDLATLTHAHMYEQPPSLHAINPAVPVAVDAVISRALAKDPAQRYPSVAQFAAALRSAAGIEGEPTVPSTDMVGGVTATTAPLPAGAFAAGVPGLPPRAAESPTNVARARKQSSPGRWLATGLIGLLLVALLVGGEQYLTRNTGHTGSNATASATTNTLPTATATATAQPTATSAVSSIAAVPPCSSTTTLSISQDATCIPAPPASASLQETPVVSDPSPECPANGTWLTYNATKVQCVGADGTQVIATTANQLGCIEAQSSKPTDGYASVFVTQGTGNPVLVFRQGEIPTGNGSGEFSSYGYFFEVSAQNDQYIFYRIDSSGNSTTIVPNGSIPEPLADHYVMSVYYTGTNFYFYINGQSIGTATDAPTPPISGGWFGLCVDPGSASSGTASFREAQDWSASS